MKKKVFSKPLIFFPEKEDVTVDVDIRFVGRIKNKKQLIKTDQDVD